MTTRNCLDDCPGVVHPREHSREHCQLLGGLPQWRPVPVEGRAPELPPGTRRRTVTSGNHDQRVVA